MTLKHDLVRKSNLARKQSNAEYYFLHKGFLHVLLLSLLFACSGPDESPEATKPPSKAGKLNIQIVCAAQFPSGHRYSHMLRMNNELNLVEFMGGFGQRILVRQTDVVEHHQDVLKAIFVSNENGKAGSTFFELSIDRTTLTYSLTYFPNKVSSAETRSQEVSGRCNVLQGEGFKR
jgi:hypothetical protein